MKRATKTRASAPALATINLLVPQALKRQIEAAAEKEHLSISAYTIQCLERCMPKVVQDQV